MKKLVMIIFLFALLFGISCINADALESPQESAPFEIISNTDKQNLYNSLSDEAKKSLSNLGIDGIDYNSINDLTFEKIISEIISAAANQSANPLKAFISIIAVMLFSSMLGTSQSSLENSRMQQIIDVVATLCITPAQQAPR